MKRNYSKAIMASVLASVMLATGLFASAKTEWRPIKNGQAQTEAVDYKAKESVFTRYRHSVGAYGTPDAKLQPAKKALRPTPRVSQKPKNIMRSPQNPRGTMYGVVNRHATMNYNTDAFLGKIDMATGKLTKMYNSPYLCPYIGEDYQLQTNAYRKGQIICPSGATETVSNVWYVINFETGELEDEILFPNEPYANAYTMTYDPDKDLIYTLSIDNEAGKDGWLCIVNPNEQNGVFKWSLTPVGSLRDKLGFCAAIAYNPKDKQIYVFNWDNSVYVVDPDAADIERGYRKVGEIDSDILYFGDEGITGQVVYSPADEMFVMIYRDNAAQANRILYLHPETFEVFEGEYVGKEQTPYFAQIFCLDDYAEADAPELAPEPSFNFDKASLTGSINVTAPTYTYVGVSLDGINFKTVVTVDGKEIYSGNPKAGETIKIDQTLSEGLHVFEVISYVGEDASPVRRVAYYVGNDSPKAPTNLKLSGNELSWKAVGAKGANEGYVDVAAVTYDVYLNGVKQNTTPLTETKFTLTPPEAQSQCNITVVATANGHSSEPGQLSEIYGKALNLPVFHKPTQQESKLYRTINHNGDGRVWFWTDESDKIDAISGSNHYGWAMVVGYTDNADDWLIFPLMHFPSTEYLYSFDFDIAGVYSIETIESYEIYLAKEPTVKSCFEGLNVYSDNYYRASTDWEHKTINFAVKEAGDYYLAIRINSNKDTDPSGQGLFFNDFDIKVAEGKSTAVPGDPTKVEIKPDENGDNEFDAIVTLPTLDITGKPLPADDVITVTVSYLTQSVKGTGHPGETITIHKSVNDCGFANITITPENSNGTGYPRTYRHYIGIDRPLCPTDVAGTMSADNMTMHLTWKAPGSIGHNGGFVATDELKYNIYTQSGVAMSKIGETDKLEYDFTPFTGDVRDLATYYVGPVAQNDGGESANTLFLREDFGTPYELPMKEEWGTQKFKYGPYTFDLQGVFANSFWSNTNNASGIGVGDPVFVDGGVMAYSQAGPCESRIIYPKASTTGIKKVLFRTRYWDYKDVPGTIEVYGRRYGKEEETLLGTIKTNRPAKGEWVDSEIALPADYCDCPWIQIRVGAHLVGGASEYLIFDNFELIPDADIDLAVTSVVGLTQVSVGDNLAYDVIVANAGRERTGGTLKVQFTDKDGNVVASRETPIVALTTNQTFEYRAEFEVTGLFRDLGDIKLSAIVDNDNDENYSNNTRSLDVRVMGSQLPVVTDLAADVKDEGVTLSWSTPNTEYGDFENFETHTPFEITENIGFFGNVNNDDLYPIDLGDEASGKMLEWENSKQKQAWTVVDLEQLGMMNDSRIAPHSGKKVLMARPGYYGDETATPVQSSKWLVSPEIKQGSGLSFWLSSMSASYTEYVELWASETDTHFDEANKTSVKNGAWRKKFSFSKSGAETWELIKWPEFTSREKYFALRFCSYDGTAVVIDDISFTPKNMLNREISHYTLLREDMKGNVVTVADNLTGTSFKDADTSNPDVKYYVITNSLVNDKVVAGPKSNIIYLGKSSVGNLTAAQNISAANGAIRIDGFEGENLMISDANGKVVKAGKVASNQAYYSVDKGVYVVKAGNKTAKLIVK